MNQSQHPGLSEYEGALLDLSPRIHQGILSNENLLNEIEYCTASLERTSDRYVAECDLPPDPARVRLKSIVHNCRQELLRRIEEATGLKPDPDLAQSIQGGSGSETSESCSEHELQLQSLSRRGPRFSTEDLLDEIQDCTSNCTRNNHDARDREKFLLTIRLCRAEILRRQQAQETGETQEPQPDLLPCPTCGGDPAQIFLREHDLKLYQVICLSTLEREGRAHCGECTEKYAEPHEAVAVWNRRARLAKATLPQDREQIWRELWCHAEEWNGSFTPPEIKARIKELKLLLSLAPARQERD